MTTIRTALFVALVAAGASACVTRSSEPPRAGLAYARIGQAIYVDGPRVTPLAVLEDSRCPASVQCVWAGRVRLSIRVSLGRGDEVREIEAGKPIRVADGTLELADVQPDRMSVDRPMGPRAYRFGFKFMGGL